MICPKCEDKDIEMVIQDDSFDYGAGHHGPGGTEVIVYWVCPECGHDEDYDGEDKPEW